MIYSQKKQPTFEPLGKDYDQLLEAPLKLYALMALLLGLSQGLGKITFRRPCFGGRGLGWAEGTLIYSYLCVYIYIHVFFNNVVLVPRRNWYEGGRYRVGYIVGLGSGWT